MIWESVRHTVLSFVTEPSPSAGFNANPTSGYGDLTVNFTDTSGNGPTGWSWDFGDGGNSPLQNPQHIYPMVSASTTYTVRLFVTNAYGISTAFGSIFVTETVPFCRI